ncbi:MAG: hypothetical protein KJS83_12730 [Xanthomonadaceae bacterium]|nr:hypothetical protein [Xanthomonadaceae bacterium]
MNGQPTALRIMLSLRSFSKRDIRHAMCMQDWPWVDERRPELLDSE